MKLNVEIKDMIHIEKVWGYEKWIYNGLEYCGKLLVFSKKGNKFSMHYHINKKESWYVQSGSFIFIWIDTEIGKINNICIEQGQSVTIERGLPHQLVCLCDNSIIFEVSTTHFDDDSYRIYKDTPFDLVNNIK